MTYKEEVRDENTLEILSIPAKVTGTNGAPLIAKDLRASYCMISKMKWILTAFASPQQMIVLIEILKLLKFIF